MKRVLYTCDAPDCETSDYKLGAAVRGFNRAREHYCLTHYPYTLCAGCGARLRPSQTGLGQWPGTKSRQGSSPPRCANCAAGGFISKSDLNFVGSNTHPMNLEHVELAKRYLKRKNAMDIAWMLGIIDG